MSNPRPVSGLVCGDWCYNIGASALAVPLADAKIDLGHCELGNFLSLLLRVVVVSEDREDPYTAPCLQESLILIHHIMAPSRAPSALLLHSLRSLAVENSSCGAAARTLSTTASARQEAEVQRTSFYQNPDPATVFVPRLERKLMKAGNPPIGSRRRRAALAQSPGIPFDQLPYQCFQEARKILVEDRAEKLKKIETERARISRLETADPATFRGGEAYKQKRLKSMRAELEELKILADINDPNVKRRFEDGKGEIVSRSFPRPPLTIESRRHE